MSSVKIVEDLKNIVDSNIYHVGAIADCMLSQEWESSLDGFTHAEVEKSAEIDGVEADNAFGSLEV